MSNTTINIFDLVSRERLQTFSDVFAKKHKIACVMLDLNGKPITEPSGYCQLCRLIRSTKMGDSDCIEQGKRIANAVIRTGQYAIETCVRSGFADASAPLIVNDKHIASWNIGQANIQEKTTEKDIREYAKKIGIAPDELVAAFQEKQHKSQHLTTDQFRNIVEDLLRYSKLLVSSAEMHYASIISHLKSSTG